MTSFVCDPSWYNFSYSLSWSDNCEVAEVLSDIPFISVGILVFGVSTLLLVMNLKTVSPSTLLLFTSVLLAFIAAVLDSSQTLANGIALNTTSVASGHVIRTREVLFALSVGFRFLFYWSYVAEPSRKDSSATTTQRTWRIDLLIFKSIHEPHVGSWMHWGLPGKLVGSGLLVTILIITILQIVWRVVPQFHLYGNVYATDTVLELLVSFLLLLKLLLNTTTLNSVDSVSVHTFSECLAPISGFLVNIAIAVGNLLCFAFTESTVGRLLQAFEVYIIFVFVMVTAFLRHRDILLSTTSSQIKKRRDVVFTLPEPARGSAFRITPPLIETPRMSTIFGISIAPQNKESSREALRRSAGRSLNNVTSWLSPRISRYRSHHEDEGVKLWNAEKVKVEPLYTEDIDIGQRASFETSTQVSKERPELVRDAYANHMPALDAQSTRSTEGPVQDGQVPRGDVSQRTIPLRIRTSTVPVPTILLSTTGVKHAETPLEPSPVYGLGGIQSLASASDSKTSLDELLRRQDELDQSIEALGLFSPETSENQPYSDPVLNDRSVELTRSHSTGQRTVCSDISLSNFPVPPWLTTSVPPLPPSSLSSIKRIRGDRRVRLAAAQPTPAQDPYDFVPPRTLASLVDSSGSPRFNSIPHTPTGEENEALSAEAGKFSHYESGEPQYNVTSFIDGLTTPSVSGQGNEERSRLPTENESFGTVETSTDMRQTLPVPRSVEGLPGATKVHPFVRSSRLSQGDIIHVPDETLTSHSLTTGPSQQKDRAEKVVTRRQRGPGSAEGVQRKPVRRRPPPLAIQSYTEHETGTLRVQLLADELD